MMRPSRATQPYRAGVRTPSMALMAMLRGRPFFMANPMDLQRAQQLLVSQRARRRT